MTFKTLNTLYTLTDAGDGGFLIMGNPDYCPKPTLVTLEGEVKVGESVVFRYVRAEDRPQCKSRTVLTSRVISIFE